MLADYMKRGGECKGKCRNNYKKILKPLFSFHQSEMTGSKTFSNAKYLFCK